MGNIIRYSGNPPCHCHTQAAYEQIRDRTEQAEKQPEECGQYAIKHMPCLMSARSH